MRGVMQALKWLLGQLLGHAGDHGWQMTYVTEPVRLVSGEQALGHLMFRTRRGKPEYRRERPRERLGAHLNDMTDV